MDAQNPSLLPKPFLLTSGTEERTWAPLGCHPQSCAVTLHTPLVSLGSAVGAWVKERQGIAVGGLEGPQQLPPNISSLSP